jgi:copper chaperone CopZ
VLAYGFVEILSGIWQWLLAGLAISALVSVLVPEQSLADTAWATGLTGLLVMLAVGIPLYVCNTGSLPIAAALVQAGMSPGAALVFLMAGPATNAATVAAVWRTFGRRVTAIYLGTIVAGSLAFGWGFDQVVRPTAATVAACHREAPGWPGHVSTVALLGLCAYLALRGRCVRAPALAGACCAPGSSAESLALEFRVSGLTCPNCARTLQRAISALAGVRAVAVSHEAGTVSVHGAGLCRDRVFAAVREAGFEPG